MNCVAGFPRLVGGASDEQGTLGGIDFCSRHLCDTMKAACGVVQQVRDLQWRTLGRNDFCSTLLQNRIGAACGGASKWWERLLWQAFSDWKLQVRGTSEAH